MILSGEKLPGTRLVLHDLEQELKIGRGPIREALMRLDRSGIIKNIPYKGAIVASPPSFKEIVSIFEVRMKLEVQLAVEALQNLDKRKIKQLEKLHKEMEEIKPDFYTTDRKFHDIIYQAANQSYIYMIVQKLIQTVEAYLTLYRQNTEDCKVFNQDHQSILDAIKDKDQDALTEHLTRNIERGLQVIEKTYHRLS